MLFLRLCLSMVFGLCRKNWWLYFLSAVLIQQEHKMLAYWRRHGQGLMSLQLEIYLSSSKWSFLLLQVALFADCGYEQEVNILIPLNRYLGSCSWMPSGASVQAVGCRFLEALLIKSDWLFFVLQKLPRSWIQWESTSGTTIKTEIVFTKFVIISSAQV